MRPPRPALAAAAIACALGVCAAALPAPADAAARLRIERPLARDCAAAASPSGTSGIAARAWRAPASGVLTARLLGDQRSDWDLVIASAQGPVAASTAFGSREVASLPVEAGEAVTVRACRLDGPRTRAPLELEFRRAKAARPAPRLSLESVAIGGKRELRRLEALGFDVTHDVSEQAATIVLHGARERARLAAAGFEATTLVADLAAQDEAERAAERGPAARSALPSGRDSYRQYADYTSEMKALVQANPALVREVEIGTTVEDRPIQGVEIAADVLRRDDGRPVYLNFGAHHAREWPSAEWPMEFAIDLVAAFNDAGDPNHAQALDVLTAARVVILPVVNVDGFLASRSFGFNPVTDDDPNATLPQILAGAAAYRRKNCRPLNPAEALIPCAQRTGSGVDLNRNYGYWWGGPGSSADPSSQGYRGPAPFSEPEADAVRDFSASVHPTVFITNHTFTEDGKWLRQPGFDAPFLPADGIGALTPDEAAMKALGDEMAVATGYTSERGYETLGDITGATEDWNYFAQGTYGYTPEARGSNFHPSYAQGVVDEYLGDAAHPGLGVREAYLIAGAYAADPAHHSVIEGTAPPGATLRLRKQFDAPAHPNQGGLTVAETLDTALEVGAAGAYEWHVNPSSRPDLDPGPGQDPPAETWTMTCERPGQGSFGPQEVSVGRGGSATVDWGAACGVDPAVNAPPVADFSASPAAPLSGQIVAFVSTSDDPDGAIATTEWDLDADGEFDDSTALAATRTFAEPGAYAVSVRVTDDDGAAATATRTVAVAAAPVPPAAPTLAPRCRGLEATVAGTAGPDLISGTPGADVIAARGGADRISAGAGDDVVCAGAGRDRVTGGAGRDVLAGGRGRDRLSGGAGQDLLVGGRGRDRCAGGPGADRARRCP
ncbi:MAG: M14 family zinc carboxypeptidase [Solirubrobacterales bacterium]